MIADIEKKESEIKKIWLENRTSKKMGEIFVQLLGEYFPEEIKESNYKVTKGWLFFMRLVKKLKAEVEDVNISRDLKELSDEDIEEVQNTNRKRMILMLREVLKRYEGNPNRLAKIDIGELRRIYQTIQKLEGDKERTSIQRGKLGLEAVRTLLPYQRLSIPQLEELKEKLNESFKRVIDVKKAEPSGRSIVSSG